MNFSWEKKLYQSLGFLTTDWAMNFSAEKQNGTFIRADG